MREKRECEFPAVGEEGSDEVMVLGTFVDYGGIIRGVRAEGDFNEVDGTRCL